MKPSQSTLKFSHSNFQTGLIWPELERLWLLLFQSVASVNYSRNLSSKFFALLLERFPFHFRPPHRFHCFLPSLAVTLSESSQNSFLFFDFTGICLLPAVSDLSIGGELLGQYCLSFP